MRPVLEGVAEKQQEGDAIYVYHGARYALEFYGPRVGVTDWIKGGMHSEEPREYFRELDSLRGRARVWFVYSYRHPGEVEVIRGYLSKIGAIVETVADQFGKHDSGALLVDLSDVERLASATAEGYELPREGAR